MRLILLITLSLYPLTTWAEFTLASVFSDHAVVQRDQPLVVWGTADPETTVTVTLGSEHAETVSNDEGGWRVTLGQQDATAQSQTLQVESGETTITRTDILIGDVWHASGQSNMAMNVGAVVKSFPNIEQRVGSFDQAEIRYFKIADGPSKTPMSRFGSKPSWSTCTAKTVRSFSAVAFFFAATVHAETGVPIGIIDSSRGGTPIEPFIPIAAFDQHPTLQRERELGEADDLNGIWRLPGGVRARSDVWLPARLFHSRIAPIDQYAVRGCIWYQGESNCGVQEDPRDYQHKMRALIGGWREELKHPNLPFYYVQLPGFERGENWAYLREQQRLASDTAEAGMVVTIDLEHPDIHPPNKFDVGKRLANWALVKQYDRDLPFCGPMFSKATIEDNIDGNRIVVKFDHSESGLMIASKAGLDPPTEDAQGQLNHFELTENGSLWHPANAEIVDGTVVATCDQTSAPIAVRYAYGRLAQELQPVQS